MADTEPQGAPEEPVVEPQSDDEPRIPKSRLDQEVRKRKDAEERWKALEAEMQARQEMTAPEPATPTPTEPSTPGKSDEDMQAVLSKLSQLETREARRELAHTLDLTPDQAKEVHDILRAAPGLEASEALVIARGRNAELFGSADSRGYDPGQHASLRPSGGGPPPAESEADRIEAIRKIPDAYARREAHARLLGERLAAVSGWKYKKT